jgi:hypothetical protein
MNFLYKLLIKNETPIYPNLDPQFNNPLPLGGYTKIWGASLGQSRGVCRASAYKLFAFYKSRKLHKL